jgi:excisionase family DNA binding protein
VSAAPVPETEAGLGDRAETAEPVAELVPRDRLLDAQEAARLLHLPVSWVREETRADRIPHVKLGRYRRYDRADLLAWVESQKASAGSSRRRGPRGG